MRYHELTRLDEKIATRPLELGRYITIKLRQINALKAELATACALVKQYEDDGERVLTQFLRYGSDHADAADSLHELTWLGHDSWSDKARLEDYLPLTDLSETLKAMLDHGTTFLRYIISALDRAQPIKDGVRAVIPLLAQAEAGARAYGYTGNEQPGEDADYDAAMGLLKAVRMLADVIAKGVPLLQSMRERLGETAKLMSHGDRYRPEHGEIETLYHATAYAPDILRNGFAAERPMDRQGAGNSFQTTISFTHDLKIAHDLMRALKDLWLIAHGQLTAKHILSWCKAEGIDTDQKFRSSVGATERIEDPTWGTRYRAIPLTEIRSPEDIAKLYNVYLWHSKVRTNPVITGITDVVKAMETRKLTDIGILACKVRLTAQDEYMLGEAEFRLPPDRVLDVKRVI